MAVVASETYTATSAPIQFAATTAFDGCPAIDEYLEHCRRILRELGRFCAARLSEADLTVAPPRGAFYVFPDFKPVRTTLRNRGIFTSAELSERLLDETGVATIPGASCGRPPSELTLRMAYVDFDGEKALAAARACPNDDDLDETFLRRHCTPVTEAMDRVTTWLDA